MSTQIQRRRGNTTDHSTFAGAVGEITVDTTKKTVVVHDGSTTGGFPLLREDGLTAGTGITVSGTTITNAAPDQTVVLTEGANVTVTGTYPNFTIASTDTNTEYTAGTGLVLAGTEFSVATTVVTSAYTGDVDITGEFIADSYNETFVAVTSSAGAVTVNSEAGNSFSHTLSENTTFTFSNPPATGTAYGFTLKLVQDAGASGYTVTWPASIDWPSATAPTLTATASAVDVFVFYTHDGGTNWYGFVAGQALGTPA
jgi:hypothetical protein